MTKYEYLVAYSFQGGTGRCFVTCDHAIDSRGRVESVECSIQESNLLSASIMSFQLLSCREVSDQDEQKSGAA